MYEEKIRKAFVVGQFFQLLCFLSVFLRKKPGKKPICPNGPLRNFNLFQRLF